MHNNLGALRPRVAHMAQVRMRVPDLAWWPCDPQVRRHSSRLPVPWYTYQLAPEQLIGRLTWSVKRQRSLCSGSLIICTTATNDAQTLSSSHLRNVRNPPDPTERPYASTVELTEEVTIWPTRRNLITHLHSVHRTRARAHENTH